MVSVGKYYHDFPRLAKETGYSFHLHRGRIDWTDIENLDVDLLIEERDFELLEDNLTNVINCNIERDYDVKILDRNFVKIFKLSQLAVDYLSYCELYLDRCVIMLQDQLSSAKDESVKLQEEISKKNQELRKYRRTKHQSYNWQCQKCGKAFINEVYLLAHDKRRHNQINQAESEIETPTEIVIVKAQERLIETVENDRKKETQPLTEYKTVVKETVSTQTVNREHDVDEVKQSIELIEMIKQMKELEQRLKINEEKLVEKEKQMPMFNNPCYYPFMIPTQPMLLYPELNPMRQIALMDNRSIVEQQQQRNMVEEGDSRRRTDELRMNDKQSRPTHELNTQKFDETKSNPMRPSGLIVQQNIEEASNTISEMSKNITTSNVQQNSVETVLPSHRVIEPVLDVRRSPSPLIRDSKFNKMTPTLQSNLNNIMIEDEELSEDSLHLPNREPSSINLPQAVPLRKIDTQKNVPLNKNGGHTQVVKNFVSQEGATAKKDVKLRQLSQYLMETETPQKAKVPIRETPIKILNMNMEESLTTTSDDEIMEQPRAKKRLAFGEDSQISLDVLSLDSEDGVSLEIPIPPPRKPKQMLVSKIEKEREPKITKQVEKEDIVQTFREGSGPSSVASWGMEEEDMEITDTPIKTKTKASPFRRFIQKTSTPKSSLQSMSQVVRKSLTNLYGSLSSSRESLKTEETQEDEQEKRLKVIKEMNKRLKEIGVDQEWKGIPKETMRKKLNLLTHHRKIEEKVNPGRSSFRKQVEKRVQKILSLATRSKAVVKETVKEKDLSDEVVEILHQTEIPAEISTVETIERGMYDVVSESDSEPTDTETQLVKQPSPLPTPTSQPVTKLEPSDGVVKSMVKIKSEDPKPQPAARTTKLRAPIQKQNETDFSIFQIGNILASGDMGTNCEKLSVDQVPGTSKQLAGKNDKTEDKKDIVAAEIHDMDETDDEFEEEFVKETVKAISSKQDINRTQVSNLTTLYSKKPLLTDSTPKTEVHSRPILKSTSQTSVSQENSSTKKKVLFAEQPVMSEDVVSPKEELKKKKKDEDSWSSDSDWDVYTK